MWSPVDRRCRCLHAQGSAGRWQHRGLPHRLACLRQNPSLQRESWGRQGCCLQPCCLCPGHVALPLCGARCPPPPATATSHCLHVRTQQPWVAAMLHLTRQISCEHAEGTGEINLASLALCPDPQPQLAGDTYLQLWQTAPFAIQLHKQAQKH